MSINSIKLRKYLNDAGLVEEIENKLKIYTYFIDYVGSYTPYINGAGMDFDTKYTYEVEKTIKYNNEDIYYSHETETFSDDDGYTPDDYKKGRLICSGNIHLNDTRLIDPDTTKILDNLIIADYSITDEIIDNFYNNPVQENENELSNEDRIAKINATEAHLAELFDRVKNINTIIKSNKELIESLKEGISQLEIEKEGIIEEIQKTSNSKTK